MESFIENGTTVPVYVRVGKPITGHKLVDPDRFQDLVERARLAVPQGIRDAHDLLQHKDSLLRDAQGVAKRTRTQAEDEYNTRLEESELVTAAQAKAAQIEADAEQRSTRMLDQAEREAQTIKRGASDYALQKLSDMQQELENILVSVRKGMEILSPVDGVPAR